jgi:hypothetical protein
MRENEVERGRIEKEEKWIREEDEEQIEKSHVRLRD